MQAKETKLQDLIEGTKQYVVPLFQRTYSWTKQEWEILWEDLSELCQIENPRAHFIGSIVNIPVVSVPEGVAKYLLIDGQQRLTTIFILLTLLRNRARESNNSRLADEINNTLLVNQYKDGLDHYKLLPTQVDRAAYQNLINKSPNTINDDHHLTQAYKYFEKKLKQTQLEPEKLKKVITSYFSVVSIVLDTDDNPYLVFESLNAKGRPLTQADLIRNYFFMRIDPKKQDEIYEKYWLPMQNALSNDLTEFIRHYLMKDGSSIKQSDVYYALKDRVSADNAIEYLAELKQYADYYQKIKHPEHEKEPELRKMFLRLNRIEVTTVYPLLLNFYNDYTNNRIKESDFVTILNILENYLIRRFVCNIPTNQLSKIFSTAYSSIQSQYTDNMIEGLKEVLQSKDYPKDHEFYRQLCETKLYGAGDRAVKTKLILETIEESFKHKEPISFENHRIEIEHIMPQTLSEWWQEHLGENWEEIHELYLNNIGNLTLTAYNPELSNNDFHKKKKRLSISHLEMNKYFANLDQWTRTEIEERSKILAEKALEIWSYFGHENSAPTNIQEVKDTTPTGLKILGQHFEVSSWRDVMEKTLNVIIDLEPEKFEVIARKFPKYVGKNKNNFRVIRQLKNSYFIEVNLSAQSVEKICRQAIETIGLTSDEWEVIT